MNTLRNSILFGFIIVFSSCSGNSSSVIESKFETRVDLVDSLNSYQLGFGEIDRPNYDAKHKIVTYIDGTCSKCVQELENWDRFIKRDLDGKIQVVVYVRTFSVEHLQGLLERVDFRHPVLIDYELSFLTVNDISDKRMEQTYLLNKYNEIVLIGNPLYSADLKRLYLRAVANDEMSSDLLFE